MKCGDSQCGVAASLIGFYTLSGPPYEIKGVQGQIDKKSGSISVSGRVVDKGTDEPVAGQIVQIKIFKAGTGSPLKGPSFPTTDDNGSFTVAFLSESLEPDVLYIINTAYKYSDNKWEIKDFNFAFASARP